MIPLNSNLSTLKRSGIRVYTNMAREIPDCAMLTIGEPDLDTPQPIKDAAWAALNQGHTHYAPNQGIPALRHFFHTESHDIHREETASIAESHSASNSGETLGGLSKSKVGTLAINACV